MPSSIFVHIHALHCTHISANGVQIRTSTPLTLTPRTHTTHTNPLHTHHSPPPIHPDRQAMVADLGVTATNWMIHTPICAPSRAELLRHDAITHLSAQASCHHPTHPPRHHATTHSSACPPPGVFQRQILPQHPLGRVHPARQALREWSCWTGGTRMHHVHLIHKDNYRRLNMIGRERANRALIGCDSQSNATR